MTIGKIIAIDTFTKEVLESSSGSFMMNGEIARLGMDNTPPQLVEVVVPDSDKVLIGYIPKPSDQDPTQSSNQIANKMYRLLISDFSFGKKDGWLYGYLDLGYFSAALLFMPIPGEKLPSGGMRLPLWQEKELSGYRLPLMDRFGNSLLEETCFGKARTIQYYDYSEREYRYLPGFVNDRKLPIVERAAEKVIGISPELFRELVHPLEGRLKTIHQTRR